MTPAPEPKLHTGVPGLDAILGGGLLPRRTVLLKGAPGSGKTTLGLQMLVAGARDYGEPGILLSFEQAPEQLLEDAAGFGWPLEELLRAKRLGLMLVTPGEVLETPGRSDNRVLLNIEDWAEEFGARRIMIDSLSHLLPAFAREDARTAFIAFLMALKRIGLTPLLTAELGGGEGGLAGMDAYLVDTLIHVRLSSGGAGLGQGQRHLEVMKSRGARALPGAHPFIIGTDGIRLFPRTEEEASGAGGHGSGRNPPAPEPSTQNPEPRQAAQRLGSGIAGLDALLEGGFLPGSVVFAAGVSGTYKTTLLAEFLLAAPDERALWISGNEAPEEIERVFAGRGCDLAAARAAGRLTFLHVLAGQEPVEQTFYRAAALIRERGITRVGLDAPAELGTGIAAPALEDVRWLLRRLRALGVTTLLTQRLARQAGANPISEIVAPELADTIIYLGLVEIESRLEKVLSVIKHRGGHTGGELVGIDCGPGGLKISERFVGLAGVLSGTAQGRRKAQTEEIFQPLFFIRDFLTMARSPQLPAERREKMLGNIALETNKLIELLSKYFDHPLPAKDQKP